MSDTATAIMDAAERRIREAGYGGFSFREIAEEIGVKSASVHYHFPTKGALAAQVARRYTEAFLKGVEADRAGGAPLLEAWTAAFRRALEKDRRMCLCGALGAASGALPEEVLTEARAFFRQCLQALQAQGLTETRALQVMAVLEGGMLLATTLAEPAAFDAAVVSLSPQTA